MQKEFEDYERMLMLIQQDAKDMRERFLLNDLNHENFRDGSPLEDDIISLKKQILKVINLLILLGIWCYLAGILSESILKELATH